MGAKDGGDVNDPSPEPGPGADAHDRAEPGLTGNGHSSNGHHPGGSGNPESSRWAAPAWDAGFGHGERPEPLRAVVPGSAAPDVAGAAPAGAEVAAAGPAGPGSVVPTAEPPLDDPAGPYGAAPLSAAPYGPGPYGPVPPWGYPPAGPPPGATPPPTHRWGLGAYVVVEAVFLLASAAVAMLLGDRLSSSAGAVAIALVVPTVLAAGTALLITRIRGNGPAVDLGLRWSWRDVGLGLAFGLGGLVITIPASILYLAIAGTDSTSAVGEQFSGVRAGPVLAAVVFVIVVFVAPLCEEIVYRGLLWGAVERLGARRWWAFGITTVVFALAHFELTRTPLLFVVAIPIALARLYSGRLVASVMAHSVNNLVPAIVLVVTLLGVPPGT